MLLFRSSLYSFLWHSLPASQCDTLGRRSLARIGPVGQRCASYLWGCWLRRRVSSGAVQGTIPWPPRCTPAKRPQPPRPPPALRAQALLSRGDRRLSALLPVVRGYGDSLGSFRRAFKDLGGQLPPMEYYTQRSFEPGEGALPWQHIQGPLPLGTLVKHLEEARGHMAA